MNYISAADQDILDNIADIGVLWLYLQGLQPSSEVYIGAYRPISHERQSFNVYLTSTLRERLESDRDFASLFALKLSEYPVIRGMSIEVFCSSEGKALEIRIYSFPYSSARRKICIDPSILPAYNELDLQFRRFQPAPRLA